MTSEEKADFEDAVGRARDAETRRDAAERERDAIIAGLGFVDEGPDGRGSGPIYVRGCRRVYVGGYDGWVVETSTSAGRGRVHFDGVGEALAYAVSSEIAALIEQVKAAEQHAQHVEVRANAEQGRADAAEKKLNALVEAASAAVKDIAGRGAPSGDRFLLEEAVRVARGEP